MENPQSTCQIFNADCLEKMKDLDDNSVDLIFNDLPYQQTSCKWDIAIDMDLYWKQVMRIKKLNTPIFFTTTTKFGVSLIQSAPKKCFFRYDLVWVKSAPAGFLCAKKMPMRKHEMVYVFYEKLPFYDLSSHQHKFIKDKENTAEESKAETYGKLKRCVGGQVGSYDPPLPVSVVKEFKEDPNHKPDLYGVMGGNAGRNKGFHQTQYDPPLPVSVVKEDLYGQTCDMKNNYEESKGMNKKERKEVRYDPPLPVSVVKEEAIKDGAVNENYEGLYGGLKAPDYVSNNIERNKLRRQYKKEGKSESAYDPPLPVSVVKEKEKMNTLYGDINIKELDIPRKDRTSAYDPPLPTTMLEIKSTRGKHSTEKPVQLMEWIFKYYSKEGDVILDPTCGSGSTGVACKNMNRNFIGIEMDKEIFKVAEERLK